MRVITGTARGMKLQTLDGEHTRPTTEKVKEAVFSALQFELEGRRVLDLFAGSGQLGIEALSRGAAKCVFIDNDKAAEQIIKANLEHTKLMGSAVVLRTDSLAYIASTPDEYDIVFLDPPYATGTLQKALANAVLKTAAGGVIVCEAPSNEEIPETEGEFTTAKKYKYGKTTVTVFRRKDELL